MIGDMPILKAFLLLPLFSIQLFGAFTQAAAHAEAAEDELVDVTGKIATSYSGITFNRADNIMSGKCAITNTSGDTLATPMRLVIENISDSSVAVANADGITKGEKPYFDFTELLGDDNELLPEERTEEKVVQFRNPDKVRFTWNKSVWAEVK